MKDYKTIFETENRKIFYSYTQQPYIINSILLSSFIAFMPGPTEILMIIIVILGIIVIGILPFVFYLITLQNTLNAVSPENRDMPPANVWLSLIPLFGIAWQIVVVIRIASSLRKEFDKRKIVIETQNPGQGIGLAYSILSCICIIPFLGALACLAGIICWIIYWVNINSYRLMLMKNSTID